MNVVQTPDDRPQIVQCRQFYHLLVLARNKFDKEFKGPTQHKRVKCVLYLLGYLNDMAKPEWVNHIVLQNLLKPFVSIGVY